MTPSHGHWSEQDARLNGAATHRVEEVTSREGALALDPLSPVVGRPIRMTSSPVDALALEPLGPIPRFR